MSVTVHFRHIREAKLCASGARRWFLQYGFSWNDFIASGISSDRLEATGDALAKRVVLIAKKEAENG